MHIMFADFHIMTEQHTIVNTTNRIDNMYQYMIHIQKII